MMTTCDYRIVPHPKQIRALEGTWKPGDATRVLISTERRTRVAADILAGMWSEAGHGSLSIEVDHELQPYSLRMGAEPPAPLKPPSKPEGYTIHVEPAGATLQGRDANGLLYSVYTFGRGIGALDRGIDCVAVVDWPSMRVRMVHYDIAREQYFRLDYMKTFVKRLSELKINQLMLYMEARYAFKKHDFWPEGSVTPEDAMELVHYGYDLGVEIIPQVNCFGHMENVLVGDYARLREDPENPYTIDPTNPDSIPFLADLFDEMIEVFPTSTYHAGFDEVWSLGFNPRTRALMESIGYARLYTDFIRDVYDLLTARGKRMMMWGDMLLKHPEALGMIPQDTIIYDWHYEEEPLDHETPGFFIDHGFETVVCPIVGTWYDFYLESTTGNINSLLGSGHAQGAIGACGCIWELRDRRTPELHWPSIGFFAERSWREESTPLSEFQERFARSFFGVEDGEPVRVFEEAFGSENRPPHISFTHLLDSEWSKAPTDHRGEVIDIATCDDFRGRLEQVSEHQQDVCDRWLGKVRRNGDVLDWYARQAHIQQLIADRMALWTKTLEVLSEASKATDALSEARSEALREVASEWETLRDKLEGIAEDFREAHERFGTHPRAFKRLDANVLAVGDVARSLDAVRSPEEARMALMSLVSE